MPSAVRSQPHRDDLFNAKPTGESNTQRLSKSNGERPYSPHSGRQPGQGEEATDSRRAAYRSLAPRLSSSQPELPSTIPDSSRGRMNGVSSQSQEDTQPISQSFHKEFSERIKQQRAAKQSVLNDGVSGTAQSVSYTYHQGQTGHIDLLGVFEQQTITHSQTSVQDISDDGIEPATQAANVRADIYPESKRFQPPATPSTISRKHDRAGEIISNPSTTPQLPANPFAGQLGGLEGMMDASQLFNATQALSSPLINVLPSDGVSERPSPTVYSVQRPSTANPLSSPVKLPRSNMVRSVTEPQTTYISLKESQAERERLSRMAAVGLGGAGQEESDGDFDSDDSDLRRRRVRRKIDQETKDQLLGIIACPRPVRVEHGRRHKGRRKRSSSRHSETAETVVISDDIPADEPNGIDTEEETEREEDNNQVEHGDEVDELADENKENVGTKGIQVPMTDSRVNYRTSMPTATQSSPSDRLLGSPSTPRILHYTSSNGHWGTGTTKKTEALPQATQTVAIADSQSSKSHAKANRIANDENIKSGAPESSLDPPLIPQSQSNGTDRQQNQLAKDGQDDRSPTAGPVGPVSSHRVESSSSNSKASYNPRPKTTATLNNSKPDSEKILEHPQQTDNPVEILSKKQPVSSLENEEAQTVSVGGEAPLRTEGSAEEFPKSAATIDAPSAEAKSDRQPDIASSVGKAISTAAAASTIPETSFATEGLECPHAVASPAKSGPTPLPDTVPQYSNGSTPFETARSHLSNHVPISSATHMDHPRSQTSLTSPRKYSSRTITEIAAGQSPAKASDDVDLDINLLTNDDIEYQNVIDQLSPMRKERRGNDGRATKLPPAPPARSHDTTANDKGEIITSSGVVTARPCVEKELTKGALLNTPQEVDSGTNARIEAESKVKPNPRGRPRKVKPITTSRTGKPPTNGETSNSRVTTASQSKAAGPTAQALTAQGADCATVAPNRVFAHFNGNRAAFYPATCLGVVRGPEPHYRVRFDDGTLDVISGYGIKRLELRSGDIVKLDIGGARSKNYVVESTRDQQSPIPNPDPETPTCRGRPRLKNLVVYPQTNVYGHVTVLVSLKQPRLDEGNQCRNQPISVPIKDVYLTQTMWTNFRDRNYTHAAPDQSVSVLNTPSEMPSTPSTPPSRARRIKTSAFSKSLTTSLSARQGAGLFLNMAFAITNINRAEDHDRVTQQISSNGGRILHAGFDELFHIPDLEITSPSKSSPSESKFQPNLEAANLGFTCLIADEHCRRAKYIEALALGIPCLATRWIHDCIAKRRILPWTAYLLSSGESAYLNGAVRSRYLQPYAAETATLSTVLEIRPKLLHNHSVLLIMSKSEEKTMKSHPLITHALGASKVSRAINVDVAAKAIAEAQANGENWDWVYSHVNEREVERRLFGGDVRVGRKRKRGKDRESEGGVVGEKGEKGKTRVVGNEFVIQSLILGQLLDME